MKRSTLNWRIAPFAFVVLTSLACGTAGPSETDGGAAGGGAGGGGAGGGTASAGADLNGTWSTACFLTQNGTYAKTVLVYNNLALNGAYQEYSDSACQTGYNTARWTGTATVGAEVSTGVKKLDLAFSSFKNTPLTMTAAAGENQYMYCGITDWAANVEKDVLGKPCQGFAIPQGGKSFDLYKVSGTTLKFGQNAKISASPAEADRPTAIDDTRVFTRN
jgi:hypothetical protein